MLAHLRQFWREFTHLWRIFKGWDNAVAYHQKWQISGMDVDKMWGKVPNSLMPPLPLPLWHLTQWWRRQNNDIGKYYKMSASKEGAQSGSGAKCSPVELNTDQTFRPMLRPWRGGGSPWCWWLWWWRCWDGDDDGVMMMTISGILLVLMMMSIRFYQGTSSCKFVKY